jgi:KDO2-lipid IV(A) lauroyltransferase
VTPVSLKHYVEYAAFRSAAAQLLNLPPRAAFRVAERAGGLAYHVLKRRTNAARDNIVAAYPRASSEEVEALLRRTYHNLFRLAAEVLYFRRTIGSHNWRDMIEVENWERALDVYLEGRGAILASAHLGNWELLGKVLPFAGVPNFVLVRPLDNPLLEEYLLGIRESGLQSIVLKRGAGARLEEVLQRGGFISLLVDQDAGRKGAFVEFMGRPASTWRSPALLSMKTGAPVLAGCCVRIDGGERFRVLVSDPIFPRSDADVSEETLRITRTVTRVIEDWVRRYPDQYLWHHRRWKTKPGRRSLRAKGIDGENG